MWIYGASGHGKVILDCLLANGEKPKGFIDDDPSKNEFMGYKVFRSKNVDLNRETLIIGVGENKCRKLIAEKYHGHYYTVIHPSAVVSPNCIIGEGSVVIPQAVINPGSIIGRHCIINTRSSVDHDCKLGDYVHIAPSAVICGNVRIGSLTWIGAGAIIRENLTIGSNVVIGAGSVVVKDVPDDAVVFGVPGKIIKFHNEEPRSDVYIIGASGFGREIESWLNLSAEFKMKYKILGYLDDNLNALDGYPSDYKVLNTINDFHFREKDYVLMGIADPEVKMSIVNRLKGKVKFLTHVSDKAIVGKNVEIGEGTIVAPNCVISTNIKIGSYTTINLGTQIGHDSLVGNFSSIMAHVDLGGKTRIGERVFIGSNATVFPGCEVGDQSKVSAGSIVLSNIDRNSLVYGNPARSIKFRCKKQE